MRSRCRRLFSDLESVVDNSFELYIWVTFFIAVSFFFTRINSEADATKAFVLIHVLIAVGY